MKRVLAVLLVLGIAAFAFATGTQEAATATGGEFIIGNGAEPESLDPHLVSGVPEHRILAGLFEGLTIDDPVTAEPIPGVAESWTVSDDGTVYTFTLREDAVWSDGVDITADTFVQSWRRMLDPETAAPYAWFPAMFLENGSAVNAGEMPVEELGVRAIDEDTLEVSLVGPLPYVLGALTHYSFSPVPIHAIEEFGDEWTLPENFVGNGPYVLEDWRPQEQLSIVPSETYWDAEAVSLDRVIYLPIDDNNTMYNMFINGEMDWATEVPLDQMDTAKLMDEYHVAPYLGTYYYVVQNEVAPFDDPRVRKALAMSFDRETLVNQITKAGQIATTKMVPDMAGYPGIEGNETDVEMAQQLLADAGYPDGEGFPEFEILYNTSEAHKTIAEYIQQQWEQNLGVTATLVNQEWGTYLATRRAGEFQVARAGWIGDYQDPNTFLDMFITGAAMNGGRYSNSEYDRLINQAAQMPDGPERFEVLQQAEEFFITQDQGVIPIYHYVSKNMIDTTRWGGWHTNTMDYHPVKNIYLKN